jgi:hypothetical protein
VKDQAHDKEGGTDAKEDPVADTTALVRIFMPVIMPAAAVNIDFKRLMSMLMRTAIIVFTAIVMPMCLIVFMLMCTTIIVLTALVMIVKNLFVF